MDSAGPASGGWNRCRGWKAKTGLLVELRALVLLVRWQLLFAACGRDEIGVETRVGICRRRIVDDRWGTLFRGFLHGGYMEGTGLIGMAGGTR